MVQNQHTKVSSFAFTNHDSLRTKSGKQYSSLVASSQQTADNKPQANKETTKPPGINPTNQGGEKFYMKIIKQEPGVLAHAFNPRTCVRSGQADVCEPAWCMWWAPWPPEQHAETLFQKPKTKPNKHRKPLKNEIGSHNRRWEPPSTHPWIKVISINKMAIILKANLRFNAITNLKLKSLKVLK